MSEENIKRTTRKLVLLSVAMFGFGYAMVPLYNVFCELTGLNGKTGRISQAESEQSTVDMSREVTVGFDTNIRELPWEFKAQQRKVVVHPGEMGEASFLVENKSGHDIIGRAIPSVAPTQASVYFNKTECFCFSEQLLKAGETKEMKVRFIVDPKIPDRFGALTLSYTFLAIPGSDRVVQEGQQEQPKDSI